MKINDPRFNLRELVKQLILLEQHLLEKGKYCHDCIVKHLLTIEGLADEGQCLDTYGKLCALFESLRKNAQRWCQMFARRVPVLTIGQEVRRVRKHMAQHVLDPEPGTGFGTALALSNPEPYTTSNTSKLIAPVAVAAALYVAFSPSARAALKDFFFHSGEDT